MVTYSKLVRWVTNITIYSIVGNVGKDTKGDCVLRAEGALQARRELATKDIYMHACGRTPNPHAMDEFRSAHLHVYTQCHICVVAPDPSNVTI